MIIGKLELLKIYFYYIISDKKITDSEMSMFTKIKDTYELSKSDDAEMTAFINETKNNINSLTNGKITAETSKLLKGISTYLFPGDKAAIIWNLVNIGYADSEFSKEESFLLDYIMEYFNIDNLIYKDMVDTAKAIVELIKHKDWIKNTNLSYDEKTEKLQNTENTIKHLVNNVNILISECE